jgi:hypothetical protein
VDAAKMMRLVCVLLLMGMLVSSVFSQSEPDFIEFYTPVIGTLQPDEVQTFRFVALSGSMISFSVDALDDTLDPVLTIANSERDLMTNDDGTSNDTTARIEAFTVPRNGTYLIKVSGFGDKNQGQYRLSMNPGFGSIQVQEDFANNPVWQTLIENKGTPLVDVQTTEQNISLIMEGIQQMSAVTVGDQTMQFVDYYTSVDVNIQANRGWQVGLMLRYQDDQNYYLASVNNQAQWRAVRVQDGVETVLRDWSTHPALRGTNEFALGALVRGDLIEVFYDHQVLGSVADNAFEDIGRIGFMTMTANAVGSRVSAAFDNWLVTTPFMSEGEGVFPHSVLIGDGDFVIRELQRQQVIPAAGQMTVRGQDATIRDVSAGVSRVDLQTTAYQNFVLSGYWTWSVSGSGVGGCGIAFRQDTAEQSYMLAYIDNSGAYGLAHREPEAFAPGVYGEGLDPKTTSHHVILVVWDDVLSLYIDGQYVPGNYEGLLAASPNAGTIGQAVVNFDPVQTQCSFNDLWLWRIGS